MQKEQEEGIIYVTQTDVRSRDTVNQKCEEELKMKWNKALSLTLAGAMAAGMLAGCSVSTSGGDAAEPGSSSSGGAKTVKIGVFEGSVQTKS